MKLACPKCKKLFDPEVESAHCARYGHAPVKPTDQNLSAALLEKIEKKPQPSQFQSDFRLIWNEPERF